jgi:hypothetical protein
VAGFGFGLFQKSRSKKFSALAQVANSVSPAVVTQYATPFRLAFLLIPAASTAAGQEATPGDSRVGR